MDKIIISIIIMAIVIIVFNIFAYAFVAAYSLDFNIMHFLNLYISKDFSGGTFRIWGFILCVFVGLLLISIDL
jgi:hypothetical protein